MGDSDRPTWTLYPVVGPTQQLADEAKRLSPVASRLAATVLPVLVVAE